MVLPKSFLSFLVRLKGNLVLVRKDYTHNLANLLTISVYFHKYYEDSEPFFMKKDPVLTEMQWFKGTGNKAKH